MIKSNSASPFDLDNLSFDDCRSINFDSSPNYPPSLSFKGLYAASVVKTRSCLVDEDGRPVQTDCFWRVVRKTEDHHFYRLEILIFDARGALNLTGRYPISSILALEHSKTFIPNHILLEAIDIFFVSFACTGANAVSADIEHQNRFGELWAVEAHARSLKNLFRKRKQLTFSPQCQLSICETRRLSYEELSALLESYGIVIRGR